VVDYQLARQNVLSFLYRPFTRDAAGLAKILVALEQGDGGPAWAAWGVSQPTCTCSSACANTTSTPLATGIDVLLAIACGDADKLDYDLAELQRVEDRIAAESQFADVWPQHVWCS
jgi:hypothetical protein